MFRLREGALPPFRSGTLRVKVHFKSSGSSGRERPMRELSIGEVAREAGVPASTLRYYEKAGLLPAPPRRSGQRCYSEAVFGRINLIRLPLEAGRRHRRDPGVPSGRFWE